MNWERIIILCPSRETARMIVRSQEVDPKHRLLEYVSTAEDLRKQPVGRHYVDLNLYAAIAYLPHDAEDLPRVIRGYSLKHLGLSELAGRLKWIEANLSTK